jgi:adenosyl cobinamide kinase/adenosyl cobinamide phosphate guanylyltransferase
MGPHNSRTKEEWQGMTAARAMEESVAPEDRQAIQIDGLTDFLRKEYFRRLGVYINKSENEYTALCKFWKDNVSLTYKKLRDEKLMEKQIRRQSGTGVDDVMALTKGATAGQMRSSK